MCHQRSLLSAPQDQPFIVYAPSDAGLPSEDDLELLAQHKYFYEFSGLHKMQRLVYFACATCDKESSPIELLDLLGEDFTFLPILSPVEKTTSSKKQNKAA